MSDVVSPVCNVMAPCRLEPSVQCHGAVPASCPVTIGVSLSRQYHYLSARVTPSCPPPCLLSANGKPTTLSRGESHPQDAHIHYRGISSLPTLLTSCLPCLSGSPKLRKEGSDSKSSPLVHFEKEVRKDEPRRQGTSNWKTIEIQPYML